MSRSRFKTSIPFCFLKTLSRAFQILSHSQALFLGERVGDLLRILLRGKCTRIRQNLEAAYPSDQGTPAIRHIESRIFRHFGMLGAEFLRFPVLSEEWLRKHVTIEGLDLVRELLGKGQGVLAFISHFGNWEMISKRLALDVATPIHVVTRKIRDPKVDRFIREHRAMHGGARSISAEGDGIRPILSALRRNEIVVMAQDQSAAPPEGIFSPFYGRLAGTHPAAARIALKLGIPLLPAFNARISREAHQVRFGPSLCFKECPDPLYSSNQKIQWMVDRENALIETRIREFPDQWIWMHNRWKHTPV